MKKFIMLLLTPLFIMSKEVEIKNVVGVYDGDTFYVDLNCDIDVLCKNIPIRVKNIDTPEIRTRSSVEKELAYKAKEVSHNFINTSQIRLSNCTRDKYFRLNCDVINQDNVSLSDVLVQNKLGVRYNGGNKNTNWSEW